MRHALFAMVLTLALITRAADPATRPATKPATGVIGEMILQQLPEMTLVSGSQKTTFAEMQKVYEKFMPMLQKLAEGGKIRQAGPMMSVYNDFKMDQPFELEVGMVIAPGARETGELKVRKTAPFKCATMLYTGPMSGIGEAYGKLMGQFFARGMQMTGELRELYLYWEKPDSPNNVVQIQLGYK